ncbi:hypothetical protein M378DRAFT_729199 [Amanita muscaria Koide BX008]|uniref:Uncharacterized protein n=1 Tax=Amanita muscaria (strain Koide BX008) TaxID=946122 RepID=A0A0C2WNG2_AMAMK|nr:hypothetical protein M378DRAFT_729199 [Amanita muscaria Koide BX008]
MTEGLVKVVRNPQFRLSHFCTNYCCLIYSCKMVNVYSHSHKLVEERLLCSMITTMFLLAVWKTSPQSLVGFCVNSPVRHVKYPSLRGTEFS